jgi:hypothetical protein
MQGAKTPAPTRKKSEGQNCSVPLRLRSAIFPNHLRRPFLRRSSPQAKACQQSGARNPGTPPPAYRYIYPHHEAPWGTHRTKPAQGRAPFKLIVLRWRCGGGGGRKPTYREKNANMDVCVFFYLTAPGHGPGAAPPPLSR